MNQYIIIANNVELDTYDNLTISINKELNDIVDLSKRSTDWTRPITLPGTKTNNIFFKHIFNVNISAELFNPNKKVKAQINIGDNNIFDGFLQLTKISNTFNEIEYEVNIFGIFKSIVNQLSDKLLTDLDLSIYNHTRDRETIENSWYYNIIKNENLINLNQPGEGYVYPYIVYGGTTDIYKNWMIYDAFPAVYTKTIVERLFKEIGYNIKSSLFDSNYFRMKIEPFTNDKIQYNEEDFNDRKLIVGIEQPYINATPMIHRGTPWNHFSTLDYTRESGTVDEGSNELTFQDNLNQFAGTYVNATAGWYDIKFSANAYLEMIRDGGGDIKWNEGEFEIEWKMFKNSTLLTSAFLLKAPSTGTFISPFIDLDKIFLMNLKADNLFLAEGDIITIQYSFRYPNAVKWTTPILNDKVKVRLNFKQFDNDNFSKFQAKLVSNQSLGNENIILSNTLPDNYKQIDFLSDLIKEHNLIIINDPLDDDTLIIETEDVYFNSKKLVLNWEDKIDLNKYTLDPMGDLDVNGFDLSYTPDTDFYNKQYTDETNRVYGDMKLEIDNDFSDKIDKTKLSISPTVNAQQYIDNRIAPFFCDIQDEKFVQKKVKPRRLFYGGLINGEIYLKDNITTTDLITYSTKYPYCGMYDNPIKPKYDLGFSFTDKIYFNTNQIPNNNLYNMFYINKIERLTDVNNKILTGKFYLTPKDIALFDFRDKIFLLNSYWRVIKINNYNPVSNDKLTEVVLMKLNNVNILTEDSVDVPISNTSCPIDLVVRKVKQRYQFVSASGESVSQDCCASMGGVYMEGACYLPQNKEDGKNTEYRVPIVVPNGPSVLNQNESTKGSNGVKDYGTGNYVPPGISSTVVIMGNGNAIQPGVENTLVMTNDTYIDGSDSIYLGNVVIDENGNMIQEFNIVYCGRDEVRFPFPDMQNINIILGPKDAIRNPSFISPINLLNGGRDSI